MVVPPSDPASEFSRERVNDVASDSVESPRARPSNQFQELAGSVVVVPSIVAVSG